jgi:hypothetical protein
MMTLVDRIRERAQDPHRATSMSHLDPCQQYPPTSPLYIAAAEAAIELRLPPLLHKIYIHIGNGGIGPAWGVLGVEGHPHAYTWSRTSRRQPIGLIGVYYQWRQWSAWPPQLVPICNWGCSHWSCLDCSQPEAPVIFYLGTRGELRLQSLSFASWMEAWLNDVKLWDVGMNGDEYCKLIDSE